VTAVTVFIAASCYRIENQISRSLASPTINSWAVGSFWAEALTVSGLLELRLATAVRYEAVRGAR